MSTTSLPNFLQTSRKTSHPLSHHKRILIFAVVYLSFLSGVGELNNVGNPLSLKNEASARTAKKASLIHSQNFYASPSSQIRELKIGLQRYSPSDETSGYPREWGVAKQIDEHTWTMRVGQDKKMATAREILQALNAYRGRYGKPELSWDNTLSDYAQSRTNYFASKGSLDGHAGFADYLNSQDGFHKLGFAGLGENSSFGYILEGVHIIEWVYASDKPHNDNQLSSDWSYIGIGVTGSATDLIFGGKKL